MGLIKLPEESIQYFKEHVDEIFSSGNLQKVIGIENYQSMLVF